MPPKEGPLVNFAVALDLVEALERCCTIAAQVKWPNDVLVDGRKTSIPSYQVRAGQSISVKESSRKNELIRASLESATGRGVPEWLTLSAESFTGKVQSLPSREDIKLPIQEQLIVELYSR